MTAGRRGEDMGHEWSQAGIYQPVRIGRNPGSPSTMIRPLAVDVWSIELPW